MLVRKGCSRCGHTELRWPAAPSATRTGRILWRAQCRSCEAPQLRGCSTEKARRQFPHVYAEAMRRKAIADALDARPPPTAEELARRKAATTAAEALGIVWAGAKEPQKHAWSTRQGPRAPWLAHHREGHLSEGRIAYLAGNTASLVLFVGRSCRSEDGATLLWLDLDDPDGRQALEVARTAGLLAGWIESKEKPGRIHAWAWLPKGIRLGSGKWRGGEYRHVPKGVDGLGEIVRPYPGELGRILDTATAQALGTEELRTLLTLLEVKIPKATATTTATARKGTKAACKGGPGPSGRASGAPTRARGPRRVPCKRARGPGRTKGWYVPGALPEPEPGHRHSEHFRLMGWWANRHAHVAGATEEGLLALAEPMLRRLYAAVPDTTDYPYSELERIASSAITHHLERARAGEEPHRGKGRYTQKQSVEGGRTRGLQQQTEALLRGVWQRIGALIDAGLGVRKIMRTVGCGASTYYRAKAWLHRERAARAERRQGTTPAAALRQDLACRNTWMSRTRKAAIAAWRAVSELPIWWYDGAPAPP